MGRTELRGSACALALAFCLVGCPHGQGVFSTATSAPSNEGPIRFIGRFDHTDPDHPRFSWPASAIATRFTGRSLRVRLKDSGNSELQVVIDGAPVGVVATNPQKDDYIVTSGLSDAPHELLLSKRTEARMGELTFLGFEPGALLSPPAPAPDRRVEIVGDSISAGYGNEAAGATCTGNVIALENEYLSYGAIAARSLGADHVTVAWAGKTIEEVSTLYDRTIATHPESRWDFSKWTPDAVVINLGTNDFNHGDPGKGAFTKPYLAFARRIRALYPKAFVLCTLGPMLTDSYPPGVHAHTRARSYLEDVVAELHAAGDTHVELVDFGPQDYANGLGCDYHPSKKTHRLMGEQLAAVLRAELHW